MSLGVNIECLQKISKGQNNSRQVACLFANNVIHPFDRDTGELVDSTVRLFLAANQKNFHNFIRDTE